MAGGERYSKRSRGSASESNRTQPAIQLIVSLDTDPLGGELGGHDRSPSAVLSVRWIGEVESG